MKKQKLISILFLLIVFFSTSSFLAYSTPIDDLLNRIGGAGTSDRIITSIEDSADGKDYFTITSENNKPKIIGNSYLSVASGIHWYLKYQANVLLTWNNLTTDLSQVTFPVPTQSETRKTDMKYRYYLNYCTYSYSMAFWDWDRWEKEIDWMALHGINMPLALVGTEVVWRNVLVNNLGYTKSEANEFIAGPAYQAWFLMNNLEGWGGPNPDQWYDEQENLQKQIVSRMRELEIEPVLAGYSGMVPHNIKSKKGWNISNPGTWCNFQRPGFLLPTDSHFNEMAEYYYNAMKELYGTSAYYSMDPFHEGGNTSGVNLNQAFKAVYNAMKEYSGHPTTPQWVIQSWQENPRQEALNALEPGTLIVLDLFSDAVKKWGNSYAQSTGAKHEFVYCQLNNFGGRTGLHGRLESTIAGFYAAKTQFPKTMLGVGATMEGMENNPMLYESLFELPWRQTKADAEEWIKGYTKFRYGNTTEEVEQAWVKLLNSVYACSGSQQGVSESVICARPALVVNSASTWSTSKIYWDTNDVMEAAALLLSQSDVLTGKNYEYDVVDVVRQTLSDYSSILLTRINAARTAKNTDRFNALCDRFLNVILDQDELLSTVPDFMLGTAISRARGKGDTDAEKNLYEKNMRLLVTTWGPEASANGGGLKDYSNREWAGLMKDYYYPRWELMFNKLKSGSSAPSGSSYFTMEYKWATTPTTDNPYPNTSQGDPIATAHKIFENYYMTVSVEGAKNNKFLVPVEGTITNEGEQISLYRESEFKLSLPAKDMMKLYIDLNGNGVFEEEESFDPEVKDGQAIFTVAIPKAAITGETSLLLRTDVKDGVVDSEKDPICGLHFASPLVIMDEINTPRTVSVKIALGQEKYGKVSIQGETGLSVTNKDAVVAVATSNVGYIFEKWTDGDNNTISEQRIYAYYGKDPIVLTANFIEGGTIHEMPVGEQSITFNPPLSCSEKWTLEAETTFFGEAYNSWGSTLIANGTDPFGGYTFQYYLQVGNDVKLNNSETVTTVVPDAVNGTVFRFNIISDGTGKVKTQMLVDGVACSSYTYSMSSLPAVCKASKYPMTVSVNKWEDTGLKDVKDSPYSVYVENGKIVVEGLSSTDNYSIYTISGARVNNQQQLSPGVYIVIINATQSFKVVV
ncbi:alpha-N-acetylglucosaminidase [Bacteroidales bacterium OttesenSCG-928-M11]|nr:alpha-N-acetylglucosaminidase [Bacteroidales bacterium OttesenSCG-928-M11]